MDVRLPDGRIVKNVPEGVSRAELMAKLEGRAMTGVKGTGTYGLPAPKADLANSYLRGRTLYALDEIAGVSGAIVDAIRAPFSDQVEFNPAKSYRAWKDRAKQEASTTDKSNRVAATALELAGGMGAFKPQAIKQIAKIKTADQAIKGAAIGGGTGALGGFLGAEGEDRLSGAAWGAGIGGGLGALMPFVLPKAMEAVNAGAGLARQGLNRLSGKPVRTAQEKSTGIARKAVAKAMADDAITPFGAGRALDAARERGVPLALGDLGDNLRGMTGSMSRKPGKARTLVREMVDARQQQAGERIKGAIPRDLGSIENTFEASDALLAGARERAKPLYDAFYNARGVSSDEINSLLETPAGKDAVRRAYTIAANERVDPTSLGIDLNDLGEPVLTKVPSPRTLDFVKRGLDDIVEAQRDQFGRLNLDEYTRSVNDVRANLLKEGDKLSAYAGAPWADARNAYAGPASANAALWKGKGALGDTAEAIERTVSRMGDFEKQQFATGFRAALAEAIDKSGGSADVVNKLLGTPAKRKAIAKVFGGEEGLQKFLQTVADEKLAFETFRGVRLGPATAERVAEDAAGDVSMGNLAQAGANLLSGNRGAAAWNAFGALKDARRFGIGQAAERAREEAAALLTETNPAALRESLREAMRQEALRRLILSQRRKLGTAASGGVGGLSGSIVGEAQ